MDEKLIELAERIDTDVKDGFMTIGKAIAAPFAEGHSPAWLVGALTALENTVKIIRKRIDSFEGRDHYEAKAAEMIAKVSCVTESYSYRSEVEDDD